MTVVLPCGKKTVIQSLTCWWSSEPNVVRKEVFPLCCTSRQQILPSEEKQIPLPRFVPNTGER